MWKEKLIKELEDEGYETVQNRLSIPGNRYIDLKKPDSRGYSIPPGKVSSVMFNVVNDIQDIRVSGVHTGIEGEGVFRVWITVEEF